MSIGTPRPTPFRSRLEGARRVSTHHSAAIIVLDLPFCRIGIITIH
jgi:hypothetical protein